MTAWAKLHTSIFNDPKLMRAARAGSPGLDLLPWVIVFAKLADDGGRLSVGRDPAEPEDIAAGIPGGTVDAVAACLQSAEAIGVLERAGAFLRFAKWDERQAKPSDSKEAWKERQRKRRARLRKATEDAETEPVTPRHAQPVTRDNRDNVTPVTPPVTRDSHALSRDREENPTGSLAQSGHLGAAAVRAGGAPAAPSPGVTRDVTSEPAGGAALIGPSGQELHDRKAEFKRQLAIARGQV